MKVRSEHTISEQPKKMQGTEGRERAVKKIGKKRNKYVFNK